jgi:sugar (pentulose or hexulose) kinase
VERFVSFIGLDLGTSFIKAAVLDLDTFRLKRVRRVPFPDPIADLQPYKYEIDPRVIVSAVRGLLLDTVKASDAIEGIVMCTQMSCLVLMDETGNVRSNCIGWRDQRALEPHPSGAGSYYEVLRLRIPDRQRRELGNELPPGAPSCFLFYMAENKQLEKNLIPVSLADFVLSSLCNSPPTVESTNGMAYELLNLTTLQWHEVVISELGLAKLQFPPILGHGQVVGEMHFGDRKVPCYTAVGDYQCALAGALLTEGELSLNVSTGSQVSRLTRGLNLGDYQTRPFFDGMFTTTISHLPAGRSLNVLVELITEFARESAVLAEPWDYITKAAEACGATDLKVNLSFFPGPCGTEGSISQVKERNLNIGTLFRAAFENMAENYSTCATRIWRDRSWEKIVFSGGVARKLELLRTMIAGKLNATYRMAPFEEDTLLGLMALALFFSKRAVSVEQAMSQLRSHYSAVERIP